MLSKISKGLARSAKSNQVSVLTALLTPSNPLCSKPSATQSELLPIKTEMKMPWEELTTIKITGKYLWMVGSRAKITIQNCIGFKPRSNIYSSQKHQLWATLVNCLSERSLSHSSLSDLSVRTFFRFLSLILIYYYRDDHSFQWNQSLHWEN